MTVFFSKLYEWFGLIHFYSKDLGEHLKGFDITGTDYSGTPWYLIIGCVMIIITVFFYLLQYHIVDSFSSRYCEKIHWWINVVVIIALNFFIAFDITYSSIQEKNYCSQLNITFIDCIGFGFSNAIWSFLLFVIITSVPWIRKNSNNCRYTTFWKPAKL